MSIEKKGQKVLLGNGDILTIEDICEYDESMYTCSVVSKRTGNPISGILVPIRSCVETDKEGVELESVPQKEAQKDEAYENSVRVDVDKLLKKKIDFENHSLYVTVKKFPKAMKITGLSKKSVHFIDPEGKKRYATFPKVKQILNYDPYDNIDDLPEKQTRKPKKSKKSNDEKAKEYAEAKGRDPKAGSDQGKEDLKKQTKKQGKKAATTSTTKAKTKGAIKPAPGDDNYEVIQEVPRSVDYRKEGRDVYMDLDETRKGLKIRRSANGRVFWDNPADGQYSATSLKKVNSSENIVVYEYK